jgi:hypothetical protein
MAEIKGMAVRDTLQSILARLGREGFDALLEAAGEEARALCAAPVNLSAWYPLDAYASLLEAEVRQEGGDPNGLMARAEKVIEKQLSGVYRVFVLLTSPESLVKRISAAHGTYFRGVGIEVLACEKGRAAVRYTGFTNRHQVMEHVIVSFYRKALQLAGAQDVRARVTRSVSLGGGVSEVEMTWR